MPPDVLDPSRVASERRAPLLCLGGVLLALLLAGTAAYAAEEDPGRFGRGRFHAGLSLGWGQGFQPGDDPQDHVRMVAVVPRIGVGLTDPVGDDAWYRGNVDVSLEPQFLVNLEPKDGFGAGAAFFLRYQFLALERLVPYVGGGAGMMGLDFDGQFQDDGFNFILQAGVGAHVLLTERTAITLDARWHHISNAGLHPPNEGIDSALFLVGGTWFFR